MTNPIILGIAAGLLWSLLGIPQPVIFQRAVSNFAGHGYASGAYRPGRLHRPEKSRGLPETHLGVQYLQAGDFRGRFPAFRRADRLPGRTPGRYAGHAGFPYHSRCFSMARSMGHEGVLSSSTVMITTIFSAFTFTAWLYLLKSFGLI